MKGAVLLRNACVVNKSNEQHAFACGRPKGVFTDDCGSSRELYKWHKNVRTCRGDSVTSDAESLIGVGLRGSGAVVGQVLRRLTISLRSCSARHKRA